MAEKTAGIPTTMAKGRARRKARTRTVVKDMPHLRDVLNFRLKQWFRWGDATQRYEKYGPP